MFHSLPHFLTPTQTSPPERTAPDSLRREASQAATRLPRCATALRVTAPLGCGSRRRVWPKGSLSARPRPETPVIAPLNQGQLGR